MEVVAGEHLGPAGFEPFLRLLGMAFGTGAIPAGMIGEHLLLAGIAAPDLSAQGLRPTGHDVLNGATMPTWHRRPIGRKVAIRKTAEHVGKLDHGRKPRSEASHHFVQNVSQRCFGGLSEVLILHGGGDIGVTEQYLHDPRLDVLLQKPCCVTVSQTVRRRPFDVGPLCDIPEGIAKRASTERPGIFGMGEQPQRIAVYSPHAAQALDHRLWQGHKTFFVTLSDHFQDQIGRVDRGHWQVRSFANPQSTRVHQGKAAFVDRIPDVAQQLAYLGVAKRNWQALLFRRTNLFLEKSGQSRSSVQ